MSVMGNRSLAKPGSMPVVKHDAPPAAHASVMGVDPLRRVLGHRRPHPRRHRRRADVDAGREEVLHQPDVVARVGGRRTVVHERIGRERDQRARRRRSPRPRSGSMPQIAPTSLPTLSGLLTPTPTSSNCGMAHDLGDHELADEAGAPDDDPLPGAHRASSRRRSPAGAGRSPPWRSRRRRTSPRPPPRRPRSCGAAGSRRRSRCSASSFGNPLLLGLPLHVPLAPADPTSTTARPCCSGCCPARARRRGSTSRRAAPPSTPRSPPAAATA